MTTSQLKRGDGTIGYDVAGEGPLVVCVPGMGDLRQSYRFLAPALIEAGYRVATMDLRGHGDSSATFDSYDDEDTAADLEALVAELGGGPAILIGNSMGGASAIIVAGRTPSLVSKLVLIGAYGRQPDLNAVKIMLMRVALNPLWAATTWSSYLPKFYAGAKPADFAAYRKQVIDSIKRPGYAKSFSATTHTTHVPAEQAIGGVTAPALVIMGKLDIDWKDPAAEAAWLHEQLPGEVLMVDDAGHYPHSQQPERVAAAVVAFLA